MEEQSPLSEEPITNNVSTVSINTSLIPSSEINEKLDNNARKQLDLLGVRAVNASDMEEGVLRQVDDAMQYQLEEEQKRAALETPHSADIRRTQKEIVELERRITGGNGQQDAEKHKLILKRKTLDELKNKERVWRTLRDKREEKSKATKPASTLR